MYNSFLSDLQGVSAQTSSCNYTSLTSDTLYKVKFTISNYNYYVHDWICTTYFGWMHVNNHLHTTKIGNDRDIY